MQLRVERVRLRGILESRGARTIEAEIELAGGGSGTASAPIAIKPGRLEKYASTLMRVGRLDDIGEFATLRGQLEGTMFPGQEEFDARLESRSVALELGANVRMALSIAFCRAAAARAGAPLVAHLAALAGTRPTMPRLLANVYSGGIHDGSGGIPFQQIMFVPDEGSMAADVEVVLDVYEAVEHRIIERYKTTILSASSGMVVRGASLNALLDILTEVIERETHHTPRPCIGIDAAAEHLRERSGYRLGGEVLAPEELLDLYLDRFARYPLVFLEDPFDPDDLDLWRKIRSARPPYALIFGDDLFATDSARIDRELADGIVLKVNQTGTLTGTLHAAKRARELGLAICVSHRSGETEDSFICDLAAALGTALIKLGGPRRGDRTARYNRLLRLSETGVARCEFEGIKTRSHL